RAYRARRRSGRRTASPPTPRPRRPRHAPPWAERVSDYPALEGAVGPPRAGGDDLRPDRGPAPGLRLRGRGGLVPGKMADPVAAAGGRPDSLPRTRARPSPRVRVDPATGWGPRLRPSATRFARLH